MTLLRDLRRATRRFINPSPGPPVDVDLDDVSDIEADLDAELDPDLGLITDYLAGALTPDEAAAVERRLETDTRFARKADPLRAVWALPALAEEPMPREQLVNHWLDFRERVGLPPLDVPQEPAEPVPAPPAAQPVRRAPLPAPRRAGRPHAVRVWVRAAALVAVAALPLLAYHLWSRDGQPIAPVAVSGGHLQLTLADGSHVSLISGSTFERVRGTERAFTLSGEGTFVVTRVGGAPFEVRTHTAIVVVTGTEFTVHAYSGEPFTDVSVRHGAVVVTDHAGGNRVTLAAGDRGRF